MSHTDIKPTDIAREVLKYLAINKMPPTPDNFHKTYNRIANTPHNLVTEVYAKMLLELVRELPRHTQKSVDCANKLEKAALEKSWLKFKTILVDYIGAEIYQNNASTTIHRLSNSESGASHTNERDVLNNDSRQFIEMIAQFLESSVSALKWDEAVVDEARTLALQARKIRNEQEITQFFNALEMFYTRFEACGENSMNLQQGLLRLLDLLMNSTGQLLSEDQWFKKQIANVKEIMFHSRSVSGISQAEQFLQEMVQRKDQVKDRLTEVRIIMKQIMTSLITNIDGLSSETEDYQMKLDTFSGKVNQSNTIEDLSLLVEEVIQETRNVQKNISTYHEIVLTSRAEVRGAQDQIIQLEIMLQEMSEKATEDHLTGALNRRGFDNAYEHAASFAARNQQKLCFALLDIDNFKHLNDTYGHDAGDKVLVYLVESVKEIVRLEDIVSRYGGEEFAILLPNTEIESAIQILERIQRHITKKFFHCCPVNFCFQNNVG